MKNHFSDVQQQINDLIEKVREIGNREVKSQVSARMDGTDYVQIVIHDDGCGHTIKDVRLGALVAEYIKDRDGSCGKDEIEWCDALAWDFEKQAIRLRTHAGKLRQKGLTLE